MQIRLEKIAGGIAHGAWAQFQKLARELNPSAVFVYYREGCVVHSLSKGKGVGALVPLHGPPNLGGQYHRWRKICQEGNAKKPQDVLLKSHEASTCSGHVSRWRMAEKQNLRPESGKDWQS
jgi:hypothetical protein